MQEGMRTEHDVSGNCGSCRYGAGDDLHIAEVALVLGREAPEAPGRKQRGV